MSVSLLGGWFPVVLEVLAAGVLVVAVGWRDRVWRRRVPWVAGGAALVTLVAAYPGAKVVGLTDPLPFVVWLWFGVAVGALIVLGVGWRSARWWRRGAAVLAAALAALVGANGVNQFVGYYPTIDSAVNDWRNAPLPGQVSMSGLAHDARTTKMPTAGRLVAVNIPATYSHFDHRQELVYLPPIWFVRGAHRQALPVVELIGGERGGPGDWVRLGNAVQVSDAYAHRHHGYAPILVFTDPIAKFDNDTECVNGPRGNSADHLDEDIPKYVEKTFGASTNPRQWAVAGFSMGGTCALDLVVEHPDVFDHFIDISGDLAPYTTTPAASLHDLYGGNVALEKANEPLLVMRAHGKYTGVNGLFLTSTAELRHQHEAEELSTAGAKVGIWSRVEISPGTHVWQFAAPAFASAYPWLVNQLALPQHDGSHTKPA
ncbi:alpha/beta hydrolase family protein [Kribbella sp. VKM Ac-2566]|uniref:alpha/beta hydrolase n=1 Tax=Kribbella sp. VKM Ac-2566 TaxID=2512218 RepID=UPI0010624086|nr:alpha/beta hydrolase-fold protein [Kribbella sp. VKM Ac-2566]TDW92118.1 S-formylglutathione hydrolase FrmB [Kribbella sp. VKM Ac-2566]